MLRLIPYNRTAAVAYAHQWAFGRTRYSLTSVSSAETVRILPHNVYMREPVL